MLFSVQMVVIRGAGDLATGVALRLRRAGFPVVMLELAEPLVVRRTVAFAEAVRQGAVTVEGVRACRAANPQEAQSLARSGEIAVLIDPDGRSLTAIHPSVLVDARLAKRNLGSTRADASLVLGLGPGFTAAADVHAVIETMRGHDLGRVIWQGSAAANTGTPGLVAGKGVERVLRAPVTGRIEGMASIGDRVKQGAPVALVHPLSGEKPALIAAPFDGLLRGLIATGMQVRNGLKVGDLDPRLDTDIHTVSDKALAIGGGVLEAALVWLNRVKAAEE